MDHKETCMNGGGHELRERKGPQDTKSVEKTQPQQDDTKSKKTFGRTPEGRGSINGAQKLTMD